MADAIFREPQPLRSVFGNITHREAVGHVLLKIAKHVGLPLGHGYRERSPICGEKLSDEVAVLWTVDLDHCGHFNHPALSGFGRPSPFDGPQIRYVIILKLKPKVASAD
jgi:hypothetical protein